MRLMDLKNKLKILNIPEDAYCLTGGMPNECYCIGINNSHWEVYYSERGNKSGLKMFESEDLACDYFIGLVGYLKNKP